MATLIISSVSTRNYVNDMTIRTPGSWNRLMTSMMIVSGTKHLVRACWLLTQPWIHP